MPRRGNRPRALDATMGLPVHHRGHLRHRPASHAHGGWRPCLRARGGRASVLFRGQGWRDRVAKDFKKAYNLEIPEWGTAAHPLVDGDRLICVVGGAGTTCVAFDKRTGKELWRALTGRQPGYCPPVIHTFGGLRQLIIWHSDAVEALNPQTGKVYWSVPLRPTFGMSIGQPVAAGNRLFVMSFNRVSACIEVAADGQSAQIAWRGNTRRGAGACITPPFWPMAISTPVATAATSSARVWLMENASGAPSHQPPANGRRVGPMCLLSGKVTDIFSRTILAS